MNFNLKKMIEIVFLINVYKNHLLYLNHMCDYLKIKLSQDYDNKYAFL